MPDYSFGIQGGDGCPLLDRVRSKGRRNTDVPGTEMMSVKTHAESSHLEHAILPVRFTHYLLYRNLKETYKYLLEINHEEISL